MRRILYHRKALLQRQAERTGYMPVGREELKMRDYVKGAGGPMFENMLASTVHDDNNMARMVAVVAGRTFPRWVLLPMLHACRAPVATSCYSHSLPRCDAGCMLTSACHVRLRMGRAASRSVSMVSAPVLPLDSGGPS